MVQKKSNSFTLLEILIVLVVIGVATTIISTRLIRRKPEEKISNVLNEFNNLIFFARQEAMINRCNVRLFFKSEKYSQDFIVIEKESAVAKAMVDTGKKIFKQIDSDYFETKYILPKTIKMQSFYKGKKEMFSDDKGRGYCYIVPNGLVQDVMIYLTRKLEYGEQKATFKTLPFFGKFEYFEGFVMLERK